MNRTVLIPVLMFALVCVSCERKSEKIGQKENAPMGQPAYEGEANKFQSPGDASVLASVAIPKEGELNGEALYQKNCGACHQVGGTGVPGAFPPLDGSPYVIGDNVERMAAIMVYGLMGPIEVLGTTYNSAMAPLGSLKDDELAAIATYVRSAWSNSAAPVDASVFASVRQKWGTRAMFSIQELGEEK